VSNENVVASAPVHHLVGRTHLSRACNCGCNFFDKGRAFDGKRVYRCVACRHSFSNGSQGRRKIYHQQRESDQYADSKGRGHVS